LNTGCAFQGSKPDLTRLAYGDPAMRFFFLLKSLKCQAVAPFESLWLEAASSRHGGIVMQPLTVAAPSSREKVLSVLAEGSASGRNFLDVGTEAAGLALGGDPRIRRGVGAFALPGFAAGRRSGCPAMRVNMRGPGSACLSATRLFGCTVGV